jgi:hypothetical protein
MHGINTLATSSPFRLFVLRNQLPPSSPAGGNDAAGPHIDKPAGAVSGGNRDRINCWACDAYAG